MTADTHLGTSQTILTRETAVTGGSLKKKHNTRVRAMIRMTISLSVVHIMEGVKQTQSLVLFKLNLIEKEEIHNI